MKMLEPRIVLTLVLVGAGPFRARAADAPATPLILKNQSLTLGFDGRTGAWISLIDHRTQEELIASPAPRALVLPLPPAKLEDERLRAALASGAALDLAGEWLYTPATARPDEEAAFRQGRFEGGNWQKTPIPSRRGVGDDRLHGRTGDFYYRREFETSKAWQGEELMLILGAVDDFDETSLNGTRIGRTGQETPHHWETPRFYRVPGRLLRREGPNVLLIKVTNPAFDGGIDGPVAIGPASILTPSAGTGPPLKRFAFSQEGAALTLVAESPPYEYRMEVALSADEPRFTRQLTVRNISDRETVLQQPPATGTPAFNLGAQQALIFPGSLPVGDSPATGLAESEVLGPRSQEPLFILWDEAKGRGLGSWYHCEDEYAPVAVRRSGAGIEVRHAQQLIVRLKPGASVTLGKQFFWLTHGTRDDALRGVQPIYRSIGLHTPGDSLAGLREKVLYCGHPGGTPEQNYRTFGGFAALQRYLPTLQTMGVDLLWLLPIWEHGDGAKWNLYAPFDHFRVSPLYGTADELKALSASASHDGIRLLFDLVPHGPPDFTPLAREHPEWIARDAQGKPIYEWNQYAFDYALPGWQDYMRRAAEWDVRTFGAVGARVDCAAGGPPNWDPKAGDRPSRSTLAGALAMNRAIRDGFLHDGRAVVLLPEEYSGANIFNRVADLTYDAQLYFLLMDLQDRQAAPAEWADRLQRFLHDQQLTLPPGALKMRWISNHDTVSWTFQKRRPLALYGVDRMRALLALCAFIEGVPMLYQGDEDPAVYGGQGPSSVAALARIYGLRKRLPALRQGAADYGAIRASDGVFACLREAAAQKALVLISLNPQPTLTRLSAAGSIVGEWRDELANESVVFGPETPVKMGPHQVRVLVRAER